ncbi:MAG: hypothetical protein Q8R92_19340, partial [Deltaproteobacteria bacterium]|nr:hypothetical protein [Deltaproteobacteria bacterium]
MRMTSLAVLWSLSALYPLAPASAAETAAAGGAAEKSVQEEMAELRETVRTLAVTVEEQSKLIGALQQTPRMQPLVSAPYPGPGGPPGPASQAPSTTPPPVPPPASGLASLNPEIGVVGDVVGNATTENSGLAGSDQFSFRELELVFGGYVDPYSRADFAVVLNEDEGIEIEEAFLTRFDIPYALKGQVGKFRSKFGKLNLVDLNALPMVTEPLVIQDFLGPEGFSHTGVRLQRLIPNPWDGFLEGTIEFVNGGDPEDECRIFCAGKNRPVVNTHLKSYFDLDDSTGLELGGSLMAGPSQEDSDRYAHLAGVDLTLTRFMPGSKKLLWQSEFMYASRRSNTNISLMDVLGVESPEEVASLLGELDDAEIADLLVDLERSRWGSGQDGWGLYSLVDYRFHPKWSAGTRFDYVQPIDGTFAGDQAWAAATWLTFHQSEMMLVRLQYQHTEFDRPFFLDDLMDSHRDDLFLQVRFQIGVD